MQSLGNLSSLVGLGIPHGTGGGLPLGTFVINGIPMTIGGVPMQKAS